MGCGCKKGSNGIHTLAKSKGSDCGIGTSCYANKMKAKGVKPYAKLSEEDKLKRERVRRVRAKKLQGRVKVIQV